MKQFDDIQDTLKPLSKIIERTVALSVPLVSEAFRDDSNYYAPMDTGDLKRSSILHSDLDNGIIRWVTPYARRLFYNPQYNFSKDSNPFARGLWAEVAKEENSDKYKAFTNNGFEQAKDEVLK